MNQDSFQLAGCRPAGNGTALCHIIGTGGDDGPGRDEADLVPGTAYPLQKARYLTWRAVLDDVVHIADINS